jgi:hypothetical protein
MTSIRLSSAVMTHPRRLADAEKLATTLGLDATVVDPSPGAHPSTLRTALIAWGASAPGATHHLVVQDDVSAPVSLRDLVCRSAVRYPADALAFYANWNSCNGAMVRLAALAGASWVRAVPEEYTPTLAIGSVALVDDSFRQAELMRRRHRRVPPPQSGFAGFRFPREVIMLAVRWYLRYGLSYRDVEELLAERGITVDHVTIYRWVQRFTPLLIDEARPCRHARAIAGSPMKPTSRSRVGGSTCTARSTSSGRSSTCCSQRNGIWRPPAGSSPAH